MTAPSNVACMSDTLADNNLWLQASPVMIGERQCYVEEKRTTGSRGSNRGGRFAPGRGGNFRGEGHRGRGSYNGGRSYGRGEFSYRSDYGSRGGGRGGSSREVGYQRVDHSGTAGGRGTRPTSAAATKWVLGSCASVIVQSSMATIMVDQKNGRCGGFGSMWGLSAKVRS